MPYTMNDFRKEVAREVMDQFTLEERLRGLSLKQRMAGLTLEQIESYLKSLRKESTSPPTKKPKPKK